MIEASRRINFQQGRLGRGRNFSRGRERGLEELVVKEESKATYSLDYLSKITKAVVSMGGSVSAEYSSKMPLRLEFKIANVGRIHFYLAPRVQD